MCIILHCMMSGCRTERHDTVIATWDNYLCVDLADVSTDLMPWQKGFSHCVKHEFPSF